MIPLITAPHLSRVLGADGVGTVSFVESIVSYFVLFATLGITSYGQREISYIQDDIQKRSYVFWNTKILGFCTSGITLMIYFVFSFLQREKSSIYLIMSLNIIAVFFDVTWFFQGVEEFGKVVIRNILIKIANLAFIFLLVKDKTDLQIYIIGLGAFAVLGNLSLWTYLPKYLGHINIAELRPFKDIRAVLSLFLPTIAVQIYTVLDKTMIGVIAKNPFENGYYEQAVKISRMLLSIVTALGTVVISRIGYLYERKDFSEVQRIIYRSYRFAWFLGLPMCLGLMITADNFVPWFFGSGYEEVIPLIRILSLIIIVIGINNVISVQYLIPTKRQNLLTITLIIGAITNFCLNAVLIRFFASIGAAVASVIAETVIAVVQLIILRKEISPIRVLKEGKHYYIASATMIAILIPLHRLLLPSPANTLLIIIMGVAVYFATLFIEKDEFLIISAKIVVQKFSAVVKK